MGKKVKYHPVSLHVLRGAVEYCGWKFSKVDQKWQDEAGGAASYLCVIEKVPESMSGRNAQHMWRALSQCFAQDVSVIELTQSSTGRITCTLVVDLKIHSQIPLPENTAFPDIAF